MARLSFARPHRSKGKIKTLRPVEVYESSHPEHYGFDDEYYSSVAVAKEKGGDNTVFEAHPSNSYKESTKKVKKLMKKYDNIVKPS